MTQIFYVSKVYPLGNLGSHGDDYEDYRFLGYDSNFSEVAVDSSKMLLPICESTWHEAPEESKHHGPALITGKLLQQGRKLNSENVLL
jgi:hypothetical protein